MGLNSSTLAAPVPAGTSRACQHCQPGTECCCQPLPHHSGAVYCLSLLQLCLLQLVELQVLWCVPGVPEQLRCSLGLEQVDTLAVNLHAGEIK